MATRGLFWLYETVEKDTFDIISLAFYGDEFKSSEIMKVNPDYMDVLIFEAGIILAIPVLSDTPSELLPPWKRGA